MLKLVSLVCFLIVFASPDKTLAVTYCTPCTKTTACPGNKCTIIKDQGVDE